jgi:ABC-2 type transport system ATP-binding protein
MSVKISNLLKIYGEQKAVNNISFEAKAGEILGFLGPNGAGKTTTMKIISCFVPKTSGTVSVCGYDVDKNDKEVRSKIGYLPEHNPLYKDMYVREYLHFIAGLHKLPNPMKRVDEMVELTGLTRERNKLISSLSKGYRQRVGLAQAMIHNPDVLILDEPTTGLDPNQLVEIRQLIRQLGKEKTMIFSSHVMQEVEALCDKVLIINKGEIVANDTLANLKAKAKSQQLIYTEFEQSLNPAQIQQLANLGQIQTQNNKQIQLQIQSNQDQRKAVFQFAVAHKLVLLEMRQETFKMDEIFQQLTQ